MKKIYLLLIIVLLSAPWYCYSQDYTEQELQQLSKLLFIDDSLLVSDATNSIFLSPIRKVAPNVAFQYEQIELPYSTLATNTNNRVLLLVNATEYMELTSHILQYAEDIRTFHGYEVGIEVVSNATYKNIKQRILANSNNLLGVVLIGDIDVALFELPNDHSEYGYRNWPCDLYYMDLDGVWTDSDNNGIFDSHTGNIQPEIFVGRIDATNIGNQRNKMQALANFFERDHSYWVSCIHHIHQALSYTNKDWINSQDIVSGIDNLYGVANTGHCYYSSCINFGKSSYCDLQDSHYTIMQLAAHSTPRYHVFTNNANTKEYLYANTISDIPKNILGYNLFCCSACNWLSTSSIGYLGGAYLFNNTSALFVIGSTKTGSMLGFENFYRPLNEGTSVGEALLEWWNTYPQKSSETYRISWFYGLSLLGDPFIKPVREKYCSPILKLEKFDNSRFSFLISPAPSTTFHYKATKKIVVSKNFIIPTGVKVIFDAPIVEFENNFVCPKEATLETRSTGCN